MSHHGEDNSKNYHRAPRNFSRPSEGEIGRLRSSTMPEKQSMNGLNNYLNSPESDREYRKRNFNTYLEHRNESTPDSNGEFLRGNPNIHLEQRFDNVINTSDVDRQYHKQTLSSNPHQIHDSINSPEFNEQCGNRNFNIKFNERFNDTRMINTPKGLSKYQNPNSYFEPYERYCDMNHDPNFHKSSGLCRQENFNIEHGQKYKSVNKSYGKYGDVRKQITFDTQMNGNEGYNPTREGRRGFNEQYLTDGNTHDYSTNHGIPDNYKYYETQYNIPNTHARVNTTYDDRYERLYQRQTTKRADLSKPVAQRTQKDFDQINTKKYDTGPKYNYNHPPYTVDDPIHDSRRDFGRKPKNNDADVYEFTAEYEESNDDKTYNDTYIPCYKRFPSQHGPIFRKGYEEHNRVYDPYLNDKSSSTSHVRDIERNFVTEARERYLLQEVNRAHKARKNIPERHKPVHVDEIDIRKVREKHNVLNMREQPETFTIQGPSQREYSERDFYDPNFIPISRNAIKGQIQSGNEVKNNSTQYDEADETLGFNTPKKPLSKKNNKFEKIINPQIHTWKDFAAKKLNTTPRMHKVQKNKTNFNPELSQSSVSITKEKTKTVAKNDDSSSDTNDMPEDFQKTLDQHSAQFAIQKERKLNELRKIAMESSFHNTNMIRNDSKALDHGPDNAKAIIGGHSFKTDINKNDGIQHVKQKYGRKDDIKQMKRPAKICKNFDDASSDKVHLNQEGTNLNYKSSDLVAGAILTEEENLVSRKEEEAKRKNSKDKDVLFNADEVIKILDDAKHLLMSPHNNKKIQGVLLFHAIVKSYKHNTRAIQFVLNENVLSFLTIETILVSQVSTEMTCESINIISEHSCFYVNNLAKEFLASWIRTLDVCLDDQKHETKVPLLFETLARIILNSTIGSLSASLDRTKIFMCVQKVQNLIGPNRIDLHTHILNILTCVVQASETVDRNLVVTMTNIRDITKSILNKELDAIVETKQIIKTEALLNKKIAKNKNLSENNKNNTLKSNNDFNIITKENAVDKNNDKAIKVNNSMKTIEDFMIANAQLFLACGKLYEARTIEDENARQHNDTVQRKNKSLLFLNDDVNQDHLKIQKNDNLMASTKDNTRRRTEQQLEKSKRKMDVMTKERDAMKELFKVMLDNYNENMIHDRITLDPTKFEYWASVFRIASILIEHSSLKDVKMKQTLRSILEVMNKCHVLKYSKIIKTNRGKNNIDEHYTDQLNSIGTFWKAVAGKIFKSKAVDILLDEHMENALKIPKNQWLRTLNNVTCDVKLKYTILILVYILNFCQLRIETSSALVNIFQQIINETDLPDYMIKVFLFLACTEKKTGLIDYLTLSIERCADLPSIDTDHDILLTNWNHFGSYRFKLYLVSKYLANDVDRKRKKFFETFAQSNENLIFTLIHKMLDTPMDKSTLDSISNIISLKIEKDEGDKTMVDYLWSSLNQLLTKYDSAFHDNLAFFLELCFKQLPTILELESKETCTETTNGMMKIEKLNKLIQISDLLAKFILKIELKENNLDLLMQLQTTMILILKQTKSINNRRILECNVNNNMADIATRTAALLNEIGAEASPMFTSFYVAYANNMIDLCNKHKTPIEINFNYNFFFKQLINGDLIYMEQLLKLLQTLQTSLNNPLLLKTTKNFQTQFLRNELMFEYVYMFLLNLLALNMDHEHMDRHIFNTLILMLKLNGDAVYNHPFNLTITRFILKNKSYRRGLLYFVDQLLSLFLKNFVDCSRSVGKPRRVKIVEMVEENMEDLSGRFGEKNKTVLANLQEKLSRLSITESGDEKTNTLT